MNLLKVVDKVFSYIQIIMGKKKLKFLMQVENVFKKYLSSSFSTRFWSVVFNRSLAEVTSEKIEEKKIYCKAYSLALQ